MITLVKDMNLFILQAMGYIVSQQFVWKDSLSIK